MKNKNYLKLIFTRVFVRTFSITTLFTALILFVTLFNSYGANKTAVTGVWSNPAIWTGGTLPLAGDNIRIPGGVTVTVDLATPVINNLQLGSTVGVGTLVFNSGSQFNINGAMGIGPTGTGNIDMTAGGTIVLSAGGSISVVNGGVWTPGTGTFSIGATVTLPASYFTTFNDLTLTAGTTTLAAATTTVNNNFTMSGGSLNSVALLVTIKGNWTNNTSTSALTSSGAGTVTFTGSGKQIAGSFGTTFNNLTVTSPGTVTTGIGMTVNGTLLLSSGVLAGGTFSHSIGGSWTNNVSTSAFTSSGAGTINFTGTGTIGGTSSTAFNNLTISSSGTVTAGIGLVINGNLLLTSGVFGGAGFNHFLSGNWTNNASAAAYTNSAGNIVTFNGSSGAQLTQLINGSFSTSFRAVELSKPTSSDKVLASVNNTMNGAITFTMGTWEQSAGTLNLTGNQGIVANGKIVISGSGNFSNPAASITGVAGTLSVNTLGTFTVGNGNNRLEVSTGGSATFTAGTVNINGRLTLTGGTTLINGATINIDPQGTTSLAGGNAAFDVLAAANITFSSGTLTIVDPVGTGGTGKAISIATGGTRSFAGSTIRLGDGVSTTSGQASKGFDVSAGYTISPPSGVVLGSLIVNNPLGGTNRMVKLNATDCRLGLTGTLTLNGGLLDLGGQTLVMSNNVAGSFSSTSMIIADGGTSVIRLIPSMPGSGILFPIGDGTASINGVSDYSPITVTVTAGTFSASSFITASVTSNLSPNNGKHPNNASTTNYLTRYWSVTQGSITGLSASVSANYVAADVIPAGQDANIKAARLNGLFSQATNPWVKYSALGSNTLSTTTATITAGQFSIFTGITAADPTVGISGASAICTGGSTTLTAAGSGDPTFTYLWSNGSVVASSGTLSPLTGTTYTVTATDGNGIKGTNSQLVTVASQPIADDITHNVPAGGVCEGQSLSATFGGGSGGVSPADVHEFSINGGGLYNLYSGPVLTTGLAGQTVIIRTSRTASGSGCNSVSPYKTVSWTVAAQPIADDITPNVPAGGVCEGQSLSATFSGASGGVSPADVHEFSVNGGGLYNLYSGPISTTGLAGQTVIIRTSRTASGPGCNSVSPFKTVSWTVAAQPIADDITPNVPAGGVCEGQSLSATFGGGSGGVSPADVHEFSINGGGLYNLYSGSISTTGLAGQTVIIRTSRTSSGSGCNTSAFKTVSWPVAAQPVSGTLTPAPPAGNVCVGANVSATATAGSGGAETTADVLQYRTNGGGWLPYTSGTGIPTTGGVTSVDIQTYRTATGSNCTSSTPVVVSWTVVSAPITGTINAMTEFTTSAAITAACNGDIVHMKATGTVSGPGLQYEWTKGSTSGPILYSLDGINNWTATKITPTNDVYIQFGNLASTGYSFYKPNVRGFTFCANSAYYGISTRGTLTGPATLAGSTVVCPSTSSSYTCGASTGAYQYVWTLSGSPIAPAGQTTTTVSVNIPSGFTSGALCVTAQLACGAPSASGAKCMTLTSSAAMGTVVGPTSVCPGENTQYSVPNLNGDGVTYSWTAPAGSTPLTQSGNPVNITFPTPYSGNPTVCVTASHCTPAITASKCVNVATKTPAQPGPIQNGPVANVCAPLGNVTYTVPSQGSSSFSWTYPTGQGTTATATNQLNSFTFTAPAPPFTSGTLSVVAVNNTCSFPGSTSPVRALTIKGVPANPASIAGPIPGPCIGGNQFTTPPPPGGVSNTWSTAAGPFDPPAPIGNVGNSVVIDWPGNVTPYTVNVTASNACGPSGTKVATFTGSNVSCRIAGTGTDEASNFSVYPNPAHEKLTLSIDARESGNYRLTLMDVAGRYIISESISATAGSNSFTLDLSGLSKGIYMLQVQSVNDNWKTKVVVE